MLPFFNLTQLSDRTGVGGGRRHVSAVAAARRQADLKVRLYET
jgi:hypothetical protein